MTAPRSARAGFTLLEVVLASLIGMMAVLACIGMFAAVDGHSILGRRRFDEALQIERAREVVSRAMQLLIMSDTPMPVVVPGDNDRERRQDRAARNPDEPPPEEPPSEPPRFDLSYDPALAGLIMVDPETGRRTTPQRFEVVLRTQPIFVFEEPEEAAGSERLSRAERRLERERREADERALMDLEDDDIAVAPGLRGVFELTFEPGPVLGAAADAPDGTFSLWWREMDAREIADPTWTDPEEQHAGRALLLSDLVYCRWEVFAEGERHETIQATWADELPAYVTLTVQTAMGTWHQWLFEVAWSVGKEPGSQTRTPGEENAEEPAQNPAEERAPETEGGQLLDPDSVKPRPSQRPRPGAGGRGNRSSPAPARGGRGAS